MHVEEIRERKRNLKPPNPKPERKMGKREKDKTRRRKTQRLSSYPKRATSLSLSAPSRFDMTNRVSLLSLSDKSTVGMVGNKDYATGSSICS